jgi:hypothetical protein
MAHILQTLRRWAMLASVFALFGGTAAQANAADVVSDDGSPCVNCSDDQDSRPEPIDLRRFHSDLV